jgi:cell division protein FtsW (lipid II flippase)
LLSLLGLIFTLFSVDQSGVRRWVDLGPLQINVAGLVLPGVIVCLGSLGVTAHISLAIAALIGSILLLQPDASQATAFLVAMIFLLARANGSTATKLVASAAATALALATWYQPDPLEPVAEVEQIFSLLHEISPVLSVIAGIGLAVSSLSPLLHRNRFHGRDADIAYALAIYFCLCALAPVVGAFPVPLVGLGMSFPPGYWLGIGLLCAGPPRR